MSDYEAIYAPEQDIAAGPHGWIQWKGTEVCIDLYCDCGLHSHFDGEFAYAIRCPCGKPWALGQCVKLLPLTEEQTKRYDLKEVNSRG